MFSCSLCLYRYEKLYDCEAAYTHKWKVTNVVTDTETTNTLVFVGLYSNAAYCFETRKIYFATMNVELEHQKIMNLDQMKANVCSMIRGQC